MNKGFQFALREWTINGSREEAATAVGSTRAFPRHAHQSWCVVVDGERLVTSQLGMTPCELSLCARLRKALRLLETGNSAAAAAFEAGFSDQSHCKALLGQTPGSVYSVRGRASS
jgi:methylphosphotriester-DNA--protein-cysteine methyltransferase